MKVNYIKFNSLDEAKEHKSYKSGEFVRLIEFYCNDKTTYTLEFVDFGTPVNGQRIIEFGNLMDLTPDYWNQHRKVNEKKTDMKKENLYYHKDFDIRCKIIKVFVSGKVLLINKRGTKFWSNIGDIQRVY